jgi:predicted aspartyl protease
MNSGDVLEAWRAVGLECPQAVKMKALIDTGAAVTVISKVFARHCKLLQTGESEVRALGAQHKCGEHAGTITFTGSDLRPAEAISIRSVDFIREPHFACLIGRDVLRNWTITFDGRSNRVTIVD